MSERTDENGTWSEVKNANGITIGVLKTPSQKFIDDAAAASLIVPPTPQMKKLKEKLVAKGLLTQAEADAI